MLRVLRRAGVGWAGEGRGLHGHGGCGLFSKGHPKAPLINALLVNVKEAIEKLWKQRGYSSMKKDEIT